MVDTPAHKKSRSAFLERLEPGNVVAFKQNGNMLSGRVLSITPSPDNNSSSVVTVRCRNGSIFYITLSDIAWIKTGTRWPLGIYNALKYPHSISD